MKTNPQAAVELAAEIGGFDLSNTRSLEFNAKLTRDGLASKTGIVQIGPSALRSPAWLVSTIGHEVDVHINQQLIRGAWGRAGTPFAYKNEIDAFNYEINNAKRFGLSNSEVKLLQDSKDRYQQLRTNARE